MAEHIFTWLFYVSFTPNYKVRRQVHSTVLDRPDYRRIIIDGIRLTYREAIDCTEVLNDLDRDLHVLLGKSNDR